MAPIRMTGMNSGLDTEAIVKALVSGYTSKKEKVEKNQTKLEWSQEIWKGVNSKVYSLYTGLDKVRFSSNYKAKKTTVSDATKATVTAGSGAVNGTQKLKIKKMASAGYLTGGKLETQSGGKVTASTKLSELGVTENGDMTLTSGGKETTITMDKDMSVREFAAKLQEAGVNASFDEGTGRFFISAKDSGVANDFDINPNEEAGRSALQVLGLLTKSDKEIAAWEKTKAYGSFNADGTLDEDTTKEAIKTQFEALSKKYSDAAAAKTYLTDKKFLQDNAEALTIARNTDEASRTDEQNTLLANAAAAEESISSYETEATAGSTAKSYVDRVNNGGDLDTLISEAQTAMDSATAEARGNELFSDYADSLDSTVGTVDSVANNAITKIKDAVASLEADATEGAHRVVGEDAEIYLNGAMFKSDTNSFTINGLNINLTGVTGDDEITISTTTDTDAIYDKVKDFMSQYSDLVNELQGLYNADAAKDYEPLTEEQKDEMSDTEIEKWETKIKDSLLRRDSTLNGVISTMTMAMSQNYSVTMKDGSKQTMALTSLGIHTLGIMNAKANEQYAYHIDGDEDDASTSGKQDKLRAMIESDPDAVADLMSQVAQGLYKALDTKIGAKTTELSSAYTIYNDKQMKSQAEQYKKDIKQWEERIADSEDAYYKQFTAMEKALASLNSSQSALTGMIG